MRPPDEEVGGHFFVKKLNTPLGAQSAVPFISALC